MAPVSRMRMLEEGVADAAKGPIARPPPPRVRHRAARARVIEDHPSGLLLERRAGQQGADEVSGAELSALVDEEAAVGVAVPGDAEVDILAAHPLHDRAAVLLQQRVRPAVGELAARLEVASRSGRSRGARGSGRPSAPPCRCPRRPRSASASPPSGRSRTRACSWNSSQTSTCSTSPPPGGSGKARGDQPLHVADAGVPGEGEGALAEQLDPGVGLRVVGGGDHRAAVELARADQEVE